MLREIKYVNQIPGEPRKSWFTDDFFDLFVWFDQNGRIVAFQLSYGKPVDEKMLSWNPRSGLGHARVDDGEHHGRRKAAPILVRDGPVANTLAHSFKDAAGDIDQAVVGFVLEKLEQFEQDTSRPTLRAFPAVRSPKNK